MTTEPTATTPQPPDPLKLALLGVALAGVAWASWVSFADMEQTWSDDPRYSHGFLVPLFSLFLLWNRRGMLADAPGSWLSIPFLLVGAALKVVGARYFVVWLDGISLLPTLVGVALALGGRPALRWAWPSIAFLFFMVPLPARVEEAVGPPLQRVATIVSTFILQTFGLPAQAEGNVINLEDVKIGVVEACNGLGMLMMFFAYATAVASLIRRPLVDRIIIVLSAAPIAMVANILRIATTGLLHAYSTRAIADHVYHDLAGWLMMPMALAMFGAEIFILSRLFVEPDPGPGLAEVADAVRAGGRGTPLLIDVRSIPSRESRGRG